MIQVRTLLSTFSTFSKYGPDDIGFKDQSFADNLVRMYRNPNVSVGLGLRYRCETPSKRAIEVNQGEHLGWNLS